MNSLFSLGLPISLQLFVSEPIMMTTEDIHYQFLTINIGTVSKLNRTNRTFQPPESFSKVVGDCEGDGKLYTLIKICYEMTVLFCS